MRSNVLPEFSVLMSVYKKEKPSYFDTALKSVLEQTVAPTEIILVEDGPLTPELDSIVSKYKSIWLDKFKIVKSLKSEGLGSALRKGSEFVTTPWIARMDTDDICVNNRFELQLQEVLKHPDYAVIGGQIDEFSENLNNIIGYRKVPINEKKILPYAKYRNPFNHVTVLINKDKLITVGGYETCYKMEDYNLWIKFLKSKMKMKNLDKVLVHVRTNTSMFKRRGDLKFLSNYITVKNKWRKEGIGNYYSLMVSSFAMIINTVIPAGLRKFIYNNYLHKIK